MLALISDIHANLAALEAVLDDIDRRGVRDILCLGDVVGYNAEPDECLSLLRAREVPCLLRNHDSYLVSGKNCERSRVVAEIIDDHRTRVSEANLEWLALAGLSRFANGDLFVHGGPDDPVDQYIYRVSRDLFKDGVRRMFVGHTHVQTILELDERVFCNPGSVGQPRDNDPRSGYALVTPSSVELVRVPYDIARTVAVIAERGYAPFIGDCLWQGTQLGGRVDRIEHA